jgi:hypothetical protein
MAQFPKIKLKEKDTQSTILAWLSLNRIFHYRNNSGAMSGVHNGKQRFFRFGAKGSPDIIAVVRGQFVGVEVKGSDGRQSADQKKFEEDLTKAGGIYILAKSLDDVIKGMP